MSKKIKKFPKKRSLYKEAGKNLLLLFIVIIIFLLLVEGIMRLSEPKPKHGWLTDYTLEWFLQNAAFRYSQTESLINLSDIKADNEFRIAIVGDSFTRAEGTEKGMLLRYKSFSNQLEEMLNNNFQDYNYQVMNFGIRGITTLEEYFILKDFVFDYNPDIVILTVSRNDLYFQVYNLDPFEYCGIETERWERRINFLNKNSNLFHLAYTYWADPIFKSYYLQTLNKEKPIGKRCLTTSLSRMKDLLSDQNQSAFVFFIYSIYTSEEFDNRSFFEYHDKNQVQENLLFFNSTFEYLGFNYVSSFPIFKNLKFQDVAADDKYHFNAYANSLLAETLLDYLKENKLIPSCENTC